MSTNHSNSRSAHPPSPDLAAARESIDEGAFQAAAALLAELVDDGPVEAMDADGKRELWALRAVLACHGAGPLVDLLRGVPALVASNADAPRLLALGVARAVAAGARSAARGLLDELERACGSDHVAVEAARQRLRSDGRELVRPVLNSIRTLLAQGERAPAQRELERLLARQELPLDEELELLELSASLNRERLAFSLSAAALERARCLAPRADGALLLGIKAALDRWAAGEGQAARESLRQARERRGESVSRNEARYLQQVAAQMLRDLDRDAAPPTGPRWQLHEDVALHQPEARPVLRSGAGGALGLLCWALGLESAGSAEGITTMAQLRRELSNRGVVHGRVLLDERRLSLALAAGAIVLLEEERPSSTGWLWLRGFDPVGRMVLVVDPGWPGPLLRPLASQERRGGLFGFGALLVWGRDALGQERYARAAADGLMHDPRLDLIDRCELDEHGRLPPRARVARLAEEGMRVAPEMPIFYLRRGESLLAQLRAGELGPGPSAPFERWLAATHRRFPDAKWPYQIYAWALETQGRAEEAGIAWAEAQARDPLDERNLTGHARSLLAMERPAEARQLLRRAATLAPGQALIQAQEAEAALALGDLDGALLASELALDLDPAQPQALIARVDVLEANGEASTTVIDLLGRASALQRDELETPRRLLRRHVLEAHWPAARRLVTEALRAHSGDARCWCDVVWIAWCEADAERAITHALDGLQRAGSDESLMALLARVLIDLVAPAALSEALERPLALLGELAPGAIKTLALALADAGHESLAVEAAQGARRAFGEDVNGWWHLVQVLLRLRKHPGALEQHDEAVEQALAATHELAPPFAYARIVAAARRLAAGDPDGALAHLGEASLEQAPGLIWWLSARALEGLGQHDKAAQMRGRLPEVFPGGVLDHVAFLRQLRLPGLACELLAAMLAHWHRSGGATARQEQQARVELALARRALGDDAGALDLLASVAREPRGLTVPYEEALDVALNLDRWPELMHLAELGEAQARRDSRRPLDIWPLRAARAAGALSRGDATPREVLLRDAPAHPGAWAFLLAAERRLGHPAAREDGQRLATLAPGLLAQRDRTERP